MSEDHFDDELDGQGGGGSRHPMAARFRGYLPVVVDVETGGFNSATDALLEIAATTIAMDEKGFVYPDHTYFFRVEPFEGANIEAAALEFTGIKLDHPFSSFDTATLAGLAYGQTVLAKACQAADIDFDGREAHSARYDTEKTAELFCGIVNRWKQMGGWEDFDD